MSYSFTFNFLLNTYLNSFVSVVGNVHGSGNRNLDSENAYFLTLRVAKNFKTVRYGHRGSIFFVFFDRFSDLFFSY